MRFNVYHRVQDSTYLHVAIIDGESASDSFDATQSSYYDHRVVWQQRRRATSVGDLVMFPDGRLVEFAGHGYVLPEGEYKLVERIELDERFDGFVGVDELDYYERLMLDAFVRDLDSGSEVASELLVQMQENRGDGDWCGWRSYLERHAAQMWLATGRVNRDAIVIQGMQGLKKTEFLATTNSQEPIVDEVGPRWWWG